jgi:hypothetical protein
MLDWGMVVAVAIPWATLKTLMCSWVSYCAWMWIEAIYMPFHLITRLQTVVEHLKFGFLACAIRGVFPLTG